jgi:DNA polymerase I-like protein with 3'-5' exonuclease and polymerase domains
MIYDTAALGPHGTGDQFLDYQIYNGLDTALTLEVFEKMQGDARSQQNLIYSFERAMQAPALEMMLRGIKVDILARDMLITHLCKQQERLQFILNCFGHAVWEQDINPRSPTLKTLFYEVMKLPVQYKNVKGQKNPSTDRDALEKLELYFHARPIISAILAYRDIAKQLEFLRTGIDPDGRIRTSYNVAGTETGRWSSSSNAFGTGGNLQNWQDKLRRILVADPGRKFAYVDLEQAESWIVGILCWKLFNDTSYISAIRSGDLHTVVARMVWRSKAWTGDIRGDREIADEIFYREYSYRDLAKRGGHGTNYYGQPFTMAKHLKVQTRLMEDFQHGYFEAFPGIPKWHRYVAQELQLGQYIETLLGRGRHFFGRPNDDSTLREAIAYEPQSCVGDLLNLGAWRVWKYGAKHDIRLMAQLHDAILVDYPDEPELEDDRLRWVKSQLLVPLHISGDTFVIPSEAASGWNWGKFSDNPKKGSVNLAGVKKFKDREARTRPEMSGLDRVIPSFD